MPRAAVLISPQQIEIQKRKRHPLESHQIRAKVQFAGICKTDYAIFSGDYPVPLPIVLGHEWSGIVIEVGDKSLESWIGKRITAEINNTCLVTKNPEPCEACLKNLPNHCQKRTVTGIMRWDGAFQEEIIVPAGTLHKIPDEIAMEEAVFIEPLAAAIRTFELSKIKKDNFVVILGAGRLGLLIGIVAKALGADVLVVSRSEKRAKMVKKFNLNFLILNKIEDIKNYVLDKTRGLGADLVVEATGDAQSIENAMAIVRPRGVIALKSTPGIPIQKFDLTRFVVNEITLQGSRCGPFDKAIRFLLKYKIPLKDLIIHIFPLTQIELAMKESEYKPGKILIQPSK